MADSSDISLAQICDAIESTLDDATDMGRSESYDALSESPRSGDTPVLQVYPQSGDCDIENKADRSTFGAHVRQRQYLFHADLLARKRSHLKDDMKKTTEMIEAMEDILEAQKTGPAFSLDGIKALHWRWERLIFQPTTDDQFMGARFYITVKVW